MKAEVNVKKLEIREDGIFSCSVSGRSYLGRYELFAGVVGVTTCREINSKKETTARIKSKIEIEIGNIKLYDNDNTRTN